LKSKLGLNHINIQNKVTIRTAFKQSLRSKLQCKPSVSPNYGFKLKLI